MLQGKDRSSSGMRFFLCLLFGSTFAVNAEPTVSFARQIAPILDARCLKCHGESIQLGKLDLRTRAAALTGGEHGAALVPGRSESSPLYRRVAGLEKPAMPMDGKIGAEEAALLKAWIDQGAVWEETASLKASGSAQLASMEDMALPAGARDYWAFRQPVRRSPPAPGNPIDAFLEKTRRGKGLTAAPEADAATLVRRAYLDLTGLPPTPADTAAYKNDRQPGAWDRLVDRLLASSQYGERWGRHWLDVARYADSNGFEHDFDRPNAWRYRDYVIRAFNQDKPYDTFLREQLAGDEISQVTNDSLIATGFLRSHAKVGFREKDNPEFRYEYLDDMIATIGRGILGLTVQCARCHNHKFDPIAQKDYYRLQAVLWPYVEVDHPLVSAPEAAAYQQKNAAVNARVAELRTQMLALERAYRDILLPAKYRKFPQNVQDAIATPEPQRTPGQKLLANQVLLTVKVSPAEIEKIIQPEDAGTRKNLQAAIQAAERDRPAPIPVAMGITDGDYRFTPDGPGDEPAPGKGVAKAGFAGSYLHTGPGRYQPPPSYFLIHGDINSHGSLMKPGFVTVATEGDPPTELPPASGRTSGRRLALAEWLVSRENPLTARVAVNRIWSHHFGRGLAATLDNFGKMGDPPTHPELLDWLALQFIDQGWSFKQMHRLVMTSHAYRMSSSDSTPANLASDPDNRALWRYPMQRLDAESVRDSILAVSGGLNREMFGPAVFPKLQAEILVSQPNGIWKQAAEDDPKTWRRSVYVYRKRGLPFPMFEAFDLPDQNISCGARNVSTVPTQALILMNDDFVLNQSRLFAGRIRETAPSDPARQVELAYEVALNRPPSDSERRLALDFIVQHDLTGLAHVIFNLNEFVYIR